jgi:hypothetical protein
MVSNSATAAELACADLGALPVRTHQRAWLDAARACYAAGEFRRAALVLSSTLAVHVGCAEAHVLLVQTHLHLGRAMWPKALQVARWGGSSVTLAMPWCGGSDHTAACTPPHTHTPLATHATHRHGLAASSAARPPSAQDVASCRLALGLALGSVARLTAVPQAERSKHR